MQKIRILFALIMLLLSCRLFAQQSRRLNEGWEFLKADIGGIWEAIRPYSPGSPEAVPVWEKIQLPHCVNARDAVDPDLHYYRGPSWYRTYLSIQNPYQNGRTILHFEGSGQKTTLYVYDQLIGKHVGGYDEFSFDITDAVASVKKSEAFNKQFKGLIPVIIRVDNSPDLQMIPSGLSDFNIYGGIYRYLNLVYEPEVSISQLFVSPVVDEQGKIGKVEVKGRFYDPRQAGHADIDIFVEGPDGKEVYRGNIESSTTQMDQLLASFTVRHPLLWSPASPKLYKVIVKNRNGTPSYLKEASFGFRHIRFEEHGPFYLNGKRLPLRGTHRHEDHAGVGAAMTETMIREEMIMIKQMGANFIRLGHYQQSPIVLRLCDSLGIMVWEEIPWCRGGVGDNVYQEQAKRMLTNMIEQHFNHPAVIIWGLGNENDWPGDFAVFDTASVRTLMKELNTLAHHIDNSRKTAIRRCEFCKDIVDVYSPSIWAGWYHGDYSKYDQLAAKANQSVDHFFHAEWGGDSHAGRFNESTDEIIVHGSSSNSKVHGGDETALPIEAMTSKDGDWSESYIVNLFDWHLKEQESMPWLTGSAQWVFKDFSTPVRPGNPIPYVNQKGVVQRDLTKKESYYVFQSYWSETPMVHIYGHNWPVRWGDEGADKIIKVYSNCDEVILIVNDISYGKRIRNSQDFPAAGLRWMVPLKAGENIIVANGKLNGMAVADTIVLQYQSASWGSPAKLKMEKLDEQNGIMTIQVKALDDDNVPCLDASMFVEFDLAGDGKLLDNLGTTTGSRKIQLYNGRAVIKVQTNKGQNVISVRSENLAASFFSF